MTTFPNAIPSGQTLTVPGNYTTALGAVVRGKQIIVVGPYVNDGVIHIMDGGRFVILNIGNGGLTGSGTIIKEGDGDVYEVSIDLSNYYTKTEVDNALSGKSNTNHNHNSAYLAIGGKAADSDKLDGVDSTGFATASHIHDDRYYTESEITTLLSGKLSTSGKAADSDKLDGVDSTGFALAGHNHDSTYLSIVGKAADSDKLDGVDSSGFATASHNHDHGGLTGLLDDDHTQYYNQTRGDARYSQLSHTHTYIDPTTISFTANAKAWWRIAYRAFTGNQFHSTRYTRVVIIDNTQATTETTSITDCMIDWSGNPTTGIGSCAITTTVCGGIGYVAGIRVVVGSLMTDPAYLEIYMGEAISSTITVQIYDYYDGGWTALTPAQSPVQSPTYHKTLIFQGSVNTTGKIYQEGQRMLDVRDIQGMWTSSNDGAGSGLDADTLDGQHASAFPVLVPTVYNNSPYSSQVFNYGTNVVDYGSGHTAAWNMRIGNILFLGGLIKVTASKSAGTWLLGIRMYGMEVISTQFWSGMSNNSAVRVQASDGGAGTIGTLPYRQINITLPNNNLVNGDWVNLTGGFVRL